MYINGNKFSIIKRWLEKSEGHKAEVRQQQWHYLAVKKLSALLRGITLKNNGDFYCLNCLNSFWTKSTLELCKRECEHEHFCNIIIPFEDAKILGFNQHQIWKSAMYYLSRSWMYSRKHPWM